MTPILTRRRVPVPLVWHPDPEILDEIAAGMPEPGWLEPHLKVCRECVEHLLAQSLWLRLVEYQRRSR